MTGPFTQRYIDEYLEGLQVGDRDYALEVLEKNPTLAYQMAQLKDAFYGPFVPHLEKFALWLSRQLDRLPRRRRSTS